METITLTTTDPAGHEYTTTLVVTTVQSGEYPTPQRESDFRRFFGEYGRHIDTIGQATGEYPTDPVTVTVDTSGTLTVSQTVTDRSEPITQAVELGRTYFPDFSIGQIAAAVLDGYQYTPTSTTGLAVIFGFLRFLGTDFPQPGTYTESPLTGEWTPVPVE